MPVKHLLVESAAREMVLQGATVLVDAMRVTIAPKSKYSRESPEPVETA
jgi:hypothetical protein